MTAVALPARHALRGSWSMSRALVAWIGQWLRRHAVSLTILLPLLGFVAAVQITGARSWPSYVDDSGVYLAQAWAVAYQGGLSPYTYFYDHAPGGWIQIGMWAALTGGFNRYRSAMEFGAEVMLLAKLAAGAMLYAFGRRLGFSRPGAALAVVLFGLCPLAIALGRPAFLDNIMIAWLLAAFVLAYAPSRSIGAASGATLCFAMAVLSKETALVLLPAFAWALGSNLDRRNRQQVLTVSIFCGVLALAMWPLFALYKGELFPRSGQTSLLGTAAWQLAGRPSSGWLWEGGSGVRALLDQWLAVDPYLLVAGVVAVPVAFAVPRLRPAALALVISWLMLARGGHVPAMYVVVLLPFSALMVAGVLEALSGNRRIADGSPLRVRTRWIGRVVRGWYTLLLGVILLIGTALVWNGPIRAATTAGEPQPLRQATDWIGSHVPRDKVLVVHDAIWTDLVHRYGFSPHPIMADKLDHDPQVRETLTRIDYLVVPESYYRTSDPAAYPTLLRARDHAVEVAAFGTGSRAVHVYRVSWYWRP
ncbi:MAG TPA: hypothetical protein VF062_29325 [Candidatus Limnocylindrales bacterium]